MTVSYTVDANIVVTLNREQPRDIYESVWQALEDLIAQRRCLMSREVYEELRRVDDECAPWAKACEGFIVEATAEEMAVVVEISAHHPDWVQDTKNKADPFLVAQAVERGLSIVTFERRRGPGAGDRKLGISNVADEWNVECVTFQELARREGWRF